MSGMADRSMSLEQRVADGHRRTIRALRDSLAALEALLDVEREIAARFPGSVQTSQDIAHVEREIEATMARIARLEGLTGRGE
jgi:hypothetical protein